MLCQGDYLQGDCLLTGFFGIRDFKGIWCVFKNDIYIYIYHGWKPSIHYPSKIKSHLVTIVPMAPFILKSNFKVEICSAL